MKDEKVWDYSVCNIGGPCYHCIEACTFRIRKDKNMEQDKYPCDNCPPPHMCGYCTLCEEWEKTHPKKEIKEKYEWEQPTVVLNDQDEKENENERIIEESESGKQLYFNGEFRYYA